MGGEVGVAGISVLGEYIKPYLSRGSSVIDANVAIVTGCCCDSVVVNLDGGEGARPRLVGGDDR